MKNKIILLVLFVAVYILGFMTYKNNWFPKSQIYHLVNNYFPKSPPKHINKIITQYTAGIPVFSDRNYYDTIGDSRLESSYVLQIPRHLNSLFQIEVLRPVKIYRLLAGSNNNTVFSDWDSTDIKVYVKGKSCTHTTVVSKIFNPGIFILESGGPIASSPIIIRDLSNISLDMPITILNQNSTNHNTK